LPTTSNEGIIGVWSPTLDNTATTVYTFTPDAGQCATTQTMTITVNPVVTPTFSAVAPICAGDTLIALPTTSNEGITGTWSPALDNTVTTVYTFTPTSGLCAATVQMTITVNPFVTPVFTQVAPICTGESLTALPTTSTNGITGTWSPALNNTSTTTYTFTPITGQCASTEQMTIVVNPTITPTFNFATV
ncbi:gliding motility-associated C-terminal domain-containing protein, partial [Flavobacterium enshiense]